MRELTQRLPREALAFGTVTEQVQPVPQRPQGPGSQTDPQAGMPQLCLCCELRDASDLNPQPLGPELTQPCSVEGMVVVW